MKRSADRNATVSALILPLEDTERAEKRQNRKKEGNCRKRALKDHLKGTKTAYDSKMRAAFLKTAEIQIF